MDDPDGSYAPQSPDLSAYHSAPLQTDPYGYAARPGQPQPSLNHTHYGAVAAEQQYQGAQPGHAPYGTAPDTMQENAAKTGPGSRSSRKSSRGHPGEADVDIKTKFPVARIKRIMQADEDVGKVSQVTPVAVSKALELFMISLVSKAAEEARATSSKRITTKHLKQAIAKEEEYDFLQDIIAKVPDAPAPEEKGEEGEGDEPKRRRGGAKGKRKASDDY